MVIIQLYILITFLFLAGKDATSYLLKDKTIHDILTVNRIQRWHRDGVMLAFLAILPLCYIAESNWWQVIISSILIRLAFYDVAFNHWAELPITHLGSTAKFDILFANIFGQEGALKKALVFFIMLILFDMNKLIFNF